MDDGWRADEGKSGQHQNQVSMDGTIVRGPTQCSCLTSMSVLD